MTLESFVLDYIEERKKNPFVKGVFYLISLFFRLGCKIRHICYDCGIFKSYKVPCPVISVGNIVAGGTGKTPFVKILAEEILKKNRFIAIVARGYRSGKEKGRDIYQISRGKGPLLPIDECGDEPYWLAKKTKASVWIGKDRLASAKQAIEQGSSVIILEDGLQHRRLKRDKEVILLHAADLFGKGYFLPRGYLRDLPQRLNQADLIVVTHMEEAEGQEEILRQIRVFSKAPVVGFSACYSLQKNIAGRKIGAFCGIARPKFFYKALQSLGGEVIETLSSEDHVLPSQEALENFVKKCKQKQVDCLVCTEKDEVKLQTNQILGLPIFVLKMDFECVWNKNLWQEWCQSML
ncbi:MAG: tetraacyldisaccharide 4'-kinase, partial [Verrucomicrobia bacterium]|nr:tetraacyldisaccharide 4'-kinase [Verrucomicrobiota bacterium]